MNESDGRQLHLVTGSGPDTGGGRDPQHVADYFDPARLTQARHLAGITKSAVARRVGVSPAAVGQYEMGVTRPRAELVDKLATMLQVPAGFFLAGRPHGRVAATAPHFRSLRSMRTYQRDKAIATVEQIWELAHELERHVELPPVRLPGYDPDTEITDDVDSDGRQSGSVEMDPVRAAQHLRSDWGLGDGPIPHLVRRIEVNGVIVVAPRPDPDANTVDAFSTGGLPRPIMVLTPNRADDVFRHRFTAAHELAHLILHRDAAGADMAREREADRFAAELLTPRESILPQLPGRLDLRQLASLSRTWGVSVKSLIYRCRETGMLSDSAASRGYQRLQGLQDQPGFRPEPLVDYPHEQPIMLAKAFEVAVNAGLTVDMLAEQLEWTPERCHELLGIAAPPPARRPRLEFLDEGQ